MVCLNTIHHGDCLDVLSTFPDNCIDSCVTDPPYGLSKEPDIREVLEKWLAGEDYEHRGGGFMGKSWDSFVPGPAIWREVYRVLKPGGHALVFAGTRTQDLMTISLRLAGFEVRDVIEWLYFSGFPKSMDVSKAFDKAGGSRWASREFSRRYAEIVRNSPYTHSDIDRMLGIKSSSCYWAREDYRGGMPPRHHWEKLCEILPIPDDFKRFYDEAEREKIGENKTKDFSHHKGSMMSKETTKDWSTKTTVIDITAPATDLAKKWDGWGTALKPAHEPIILARKPLDGTVADNVERWGTGALNIDGCRIGDKGGTKRSHQAEYPKTEGGKEDRSQHWARVGHNVMSIGKGRFPANCITTEPDAFFSKYFNVTPRELSKKASKKDRNSTVDGRVLDGVNRHPTCKPTDLMAWLVRLSTPPGGIVLDPFAGSGSTLVAAHREGFNFIGIEREAEYLEIARARVIGE